MKTCCNNINTYKLDGSLCLSETLDCGQSFRWKCDENGKWSGVIGNSAVTLWIDGSTLFSQGAKDRETIENYLDLETDYEKLKKEYSKYPPLKDAIDYCGGIRILKQDFFEALITFILSQNNNIPRIKGLVESLCLNFGEKIEDNIFAFPSCDTLSQLTEEDLSVIKCGFRARYIIDASKKVKQGVINPHCIKDMTLDEAEKYLCQIVGVGKKVADCTLLFGLYKTDAFPVDVWIKRALNIFFPQGFPKELESTSGIAQQFLFHYIRTAPQTENLRQEEKRLRQLEKENKKAKKAVTL